MIRVICSDWYWYGFYFIIDIDNDTLIGDEITNASIKWRDVLLILIDKIKRMENISGV